MRLVPRSLFGRLLATAALALVAALAFAGFAIGHVFERFVMHGLDDRLDAQVAVVARAVRPDGSVDRARIVDVPPFDTPGDGWAWEVRAPGGTLRSASLLGGDIPLPLTPPPLSIRGDPGPGPEPGPAPDRARPFDGWDPAAGAIHGRALTIATSRGDATVLAVGPRRIVERPLRAAMAPLVISLLLLGAGLALAILVQLRIGLRPLATLRTMLAEVRDGRRDHVDADTPSELAPLVAELNALIDANRTALAQARGHVANLAHGLKTPLAALRLDLSAGSTDRLGGHVDRIDAQIRHHLGRARAATPAGAAGVATPLARHVADLVAALDRIHADRAIAATVRIADNLSVRCDPQDFDEMVGNLLDNGWRFARTALAIEAVREGRTIALRIADDGPGISDTLLAEAMEPGRRLDERGDGHGFGLGIARELAELHGGALRLANAATGGLVATLSLPAGG